MNNLRLTAGDNYPVFAPGFTNFHIFKYFPPFKPFQPMIRLVPLKEELSIYQLNPGQEIPSQVFNSGFYSITRTDEEISIASDLFLETGYARANHGWKGFRVEGILDFSLTGIINEITGPLKDNKISVFVISTFNTDYILVNKENFNEAVEIFNSTGRIRVL
jgi:hypothetical protein